MQLALDYLFQQRINLLVGAYFMAGVAICRHHRALSPRGWYAEFGFWGLSISQLVVVAAGYVWYAGLSESVSIDVVVKLSETAGLVAWPIALYGIAATFSDVSRRLNQSKDGDES